MSAQKVPRPDRDEWVQSAVDAAVEQGFGAGIEDPEVLDFIADLFASAERPAAVGKKPAKK